MLHLFYEFPYFLTLSSVCYISISLGLCIKLVTTKESGKTYRKSPGIAPTEGIVLAQASFT